MALSPTLDRRRLLVQLARRYGVALAVPLGACRNVLGSEEAGRSPPAPPVTLAANPFTLGVASGDPLPDGVVLWTRLAPDLAAGGGVPPQDVPVQWLIAADERLRTVIRRGTEVAQPGWAHAVHVEVTGLEPDRWYWYQFRAGGFESPIGRTRTAPARGARPERLRFAFVSCQNWQDGYYPAYRYLAQEDLALVVHLGDYIYESAVRTDGVRRHDGPAPTTLDGYRRRYALYKSDPDLQAAHAAFPWILTWDDHEVVNNYAGKYMNYGTGNPEAFLLRRAAAYRAYYEHQPLRRSSLPQGPEMQLFRRFTFGDLAEYLVLDTRQYRDPQVTCAAGERIDGYCPAALDPQRTIMGEAQRQWLFDGLDRSAARWNVIAQQVVLAQHDSLAGPGREFGDDRWDGYVADRKAVLDFLAQRRPSNPVVITGDVHQNRVYDLLADFEDPQSETLATEYVGTSISSGGDVSPATAFSFPDNPHQRFRNSNRGYVRCEITPARWQADYRIVSTVRSRTAAGISTIASFVTENGHAGAQQA